MDPASQALAQTLPPNVRRTYAALAAHSDVRAQGQQYLTPLEEKGFAQHLIRAANFGFPWRIKDIPSLAFSIARRRSPAKAIKPPNKNWPQAFAKRHPELARRKHRAMDWNRHDKNIYDKAT
ncbi:hypothetical protein EJ04DRAFT_407327, partial [Polyplosphaeria fusca]